MQDVSTAWKIAVSTVVLCFIVSIVLSLLYISGAFWNRTADSVDQTLAESREAETYMVASYGEPVPVAAMWTAINNMTGSTPTNVTGISECTIKESGKPDVTDYSKITDYLSRQGYLSYEWLNDGYSIEITLVA